MAVASPLVLLLLWFVSSASGNFHLRLLLQKAKVDAHVSCAIVIYSSNKTKDASYLMEHHNLVSISMDFDPEEDMMLKAAHSCQLFILFVDEIRQLETFFAPRRTLRLKNTHYYLIIVEEERVKSADLFSSIPFFNKAHHLAIASRQKERGGRYIITASKLTQTNFLQTINILNESGNFLFTDRGFFPDKLADFEGQILTASTFEYLPFVSERIDRETGGISFGGFETNIVEVLAFALNFKLHIKHPKEVGSWMSVIEDVLGTNFTEDKELDGSSDFAYANWYDIPFDFDKNTKDMTVPIYLENECLSAKLKPGQQLDWMGLFHPLTLPVWICSLITITFSSIFIFGYVRAYGTDADFGYYHGLIYLWTLVFQEGDKTGEHVKSNGIRIFFWLFSSMAFILSAGYCSALVSFLTVQHKSIPMDTLKVAADTRLPCGTSDAMVGAMQESPNLSIKDMATRAFVVDDYDKGFDRVERGEAMMFGSTIFLKYNLYKRALNHSSDLYVIKECWQQYRVGLYMKRNTPYKPPMDRKINQLQEAGIIAKLMNDVIGRYDRTNGDTSASLIRLSFVHIKGPSVIYGILVLAGIIGFLLELLGKQMSKCLTD